MKGVIDRIFENTTKKKMPYWVLSIGGENYSVWDKKFMEGLQEGATVEYGWAASGDFKKVTEIRRIDMEPSLDREGKAYSRSQQIVRMSCIKSATMLVSNFDTHPNEKGEITLGLARKF
ncbi:MAG: hypothetical protein MUP55_02025 [Candidatus Aenigmarchaeota archaeon]|nr:hypothetical protein [Candidatus Aenigmarchaeota archaeon]